MDLQTLAILFAMLKGKTAESTGSTPEIEAEPGTVYECGEVSTLDFTPSATGICGVVFTSGSTATVLTVPDTVIWPAWFDPDDLETDTIYELNIRNGIYGVVTTWPAS